MRTLRRRGEIDSAAILCQLIPGCGIGAKVYDDESLPLRGASSSDSYIHVFRDHLSDYHRRGYMI